METLTPKQREIREREARILELARPIIACGGLAALSIEAIASELNLARGTVYNHFPNKEEILLALAIQAVEQRQAIFQHAVMLRGAPRDRVAAIGIGCEFFADQFPELFRVEYIIRHDAVWEKTSERRRDVLRNCEGRCMLIVAGVVRDAVAAGDLAWDDGRKVEDVVFALWSLVQGGLTLELTSPSLSDIGVADARRAIRRGCNALLDGLGWGPQSNESHQEVWASLVRQELVTRFAREGAEQ